MAKLRDNSASAFVREADKYRALNSEEKYIADAYAKTNMMNFNELDASCQQGHYGSFKHSVDEMIASQEQQDYEDEKQAIQDRKIDLLQHMKDVQTVRIDKDRKLIKNWKQTQKVKSDRQIRDLQYEMCRETVAELKIAKSNSIHRKKQLSGIDQFDSILRRNGIGGGDDDGQTLSTTYEEGEAFIKRLEETAMKKWPSNEDVDEFLLHLKKRTSGNRIARYEKACRKRRMLVEQMAASVELAIDGEVVEDTPAPTSARTRRISRIASISPRGSARAAILDKTTLKAVKAEKTKKFCEESVKRQNEDAELYLQIFSEQTRMMADDDGGRDQEYQSVRALRDAKNLEKRTANEFICRSVLEDWLSSHPVFGVAAAIPKKDARGQRLSEALSSSDDMTVFSALMTVFEEYLGQPDIGQSTATSRAATPSTSRGSPTASRKSGLTGGTTNTSVCSPASTRAASVKRLPAASTLEDCNMIANNPHTWSLSVAMSNNISRWTYSLPPGLTAEASVASLNQSDVNTEHQPLTIETCEPPDAGELEFDMLTGEPIALSTMQSCAAENSTASSSSVVPLLSRSLSYSEEWEEVLTTLSEYYIDDQGSDSHMAPSQEALCRRLMVTGDEVATLTAMSRSTILVMGRKNNDVGPISRHCVIGRETWNKLASGFVSPIVSMDGPLESLVCLWDVTTAIEVGKKLQADSKTPVTFTSLVDAVSMGTETCPTALASTKFSPQASRIISEFSDLVAKVLGCEKIVFPSRTALSVALTSSSFPFSETSICILLGHALWLRAFVVEKITALSGSCAMAPIVLAGRLYSPASCNQSIHVKVVSHFMAGGTKDSVDNDPELEALLAAEMGSGKPPKPSADDIVLLNKLDAVVWMRNGTLTELPEAEPADDEPEPEVVEPEIVAPKGKKGKAEDETPAIIRPTYEIASTVLEKFASVTLESNPPSNHSKDNFPIAFAENTTVCPPVYCLSCEEETSFEGEASGTKTPAWTVGGSISSHQMDKVAVLGSDENVDGLLLEIQPEEIISPVDWLPIFCPVRKDETLVNLSAIHIITAVIVHHANRCVTMANEAAERVAARERECEEEETLPSSPLEEKEEDTLPIHVAFRLSNWQDVIVGELSRLLVSRLDVPVLLDKLWLYHKTCHHKIEYALLQKALSALQLSKAVDMEMKSLMCQIISSQLSLFQSAVRGAQSQLIRTLKGSDDRWKSLCGDFLKQVVIISEQQAPASSTSHALPTLSRQSSGRLGSASLKRKPEEKNKQPPRPPSGKSRPTSATPTTNDAKADLTEMTDELICTIGNTIDERHMSSIDSANQLNSSVGDVFKKISKNLMKLVVLMNKSQTVSGQLSTEFGRRLSEFLMSLGCAEDGSSTSAIPLVSLGVSSGTADDVSDALHYTVTNYNAAVESLTSTFTDHMDGSGDSGSWQTIFPLQSIENLTIEFKQDKTGNVNYCCEELCAEGLVSLTALIRSCESAYLSMSQQLTYLQPLLLDSILWRTKYEHGILTKWSGELRQSFGVQLSYDCLSPTIHVANSGFSLGSADSAPNNINFPSAIAFLTKYYFGVSDDAHQDSVAWISNVGMIDVADFTLTGKEIKVLATELSYVLVKVMKGSQNRSSAYVPIPGEFLIMCIRNLVDKRVTLPPPWRDSSRLHALANIICGPVDNKLNGTGKETVVRLASLRNLSQKLVIVLILGLIRCSPSVEYVQHLYDVLSKLDTGASAFLAKADNEGKGLTMRNYMARICTDDILAPGWWSADLRGEKKSKTCIDMDKQKAALFMEAIALVCCDDQQRVVISDVMVLMCMLPSLDDHHVSLQKSLQLYPQEQSTITDGTSVTVLHPAVFKLAHVVQKCIKQPKQADDSSVAGEEVVSTGLWSQTSEALRYRRALGIQLTEYQMNWLCECLLPSHTVPPTEYDAVAEPNPAVELPPPPYSLMDGIKMQKNAFRRSIAERMDVSPQLETDELLPFTNLLLMKGSSEFMRHVVLLLQADKLALPRKL